MPNTVKRLSETTTVQFDFSNQARFLEVLSAPVVTVEVFSGTDFSPSAILSGSPTILGNIVSQKITAGMSGVTYVLTCTVVGSGTLYAVTELVVVLSNTSSYAPSALPVITGDLPDGIVGAPYSANLAIEGGYLPYTPVGIIANAPTWMGFSVSGTNLVCAGLPNESASLTNYSFAAQAQDAGLNIASSLQNISVTRINITGDLPNASVGQSSSFSYTVSGGTPPYVSTIFSGSLPPNISMNASAATSGTFTTIGTFNWVVMSVDANNVTAFLPDSCTVSEPVPIFVAVGASGKIAQSPDGITWTGETSGVPFAILNTGYGNGLFLAGGNDFFSPPFDFQGFLLKSANGTDWTGVTIIPYPGSGQKPFCYGLGKYFMGLLANKCMSSLDGVTWTPVTMPGDTSALLSAYGDSSVVLFGDTGNIIHKTTNGTTFTQHLCAFSAGSDITDIIFSGTLYVACCSPQFTPGNVIAWSNNAETWTASLTSSRAIRGLAFGAGTYVAVGDVGTVHYSSDALSWNTATFPNSADLQDVEYNNGRFVAVGSNGTVGYSTDGISWQLTNSTFGTSTIFAITSGVPA